MNVIKSILVLLCLVSFSAFTVHHIKKCIRKHKDKSLTRKRGILTLFLFIITCLNWFWFSGYTYPFERTLDPVLVAQLEVSEKYVLDKPGGRFWRGAYKGMFGESLWFNPNDTEHFGATMPQLDYKNHCYVITYGQKIDTLSYNYWDIIDVTGAKAGYLTFQEEFYPSAVFIYEIPKIRIDNDINSTVDRNPSILYSLSPYVDMDTFISGEMLEDRFGLSYVQRHKYVLSEASGSTPAKVFTEGYVYDFNWGQNGVYTLHETNVSFCIEPIRSDSAEPLDGAPAATGVDPQDLRTADSAGFYQVSDIRYIYEAYDESGAKLSAIRWQADGNAYEIQFQKGRTYALDDGSFLAQLLREKTAKTAIDSFNSDISEALLSRNAWQGRLPRILYVIGLVVLAGAFLLICCKRRKKSIDNAVG